MMNPGDEGVLGLILLHIHLGARVCICSVLHVLGPGEWFKPLYCRAGLVEHCMRWLDVLDEILQSKFSARGPECECTSFGMA